MLINGMKLTESDYNFLAPITREYWNAVNESNYLNTPGIAKLREMLLQKNDILSNIALIEMMINESFTKQELLDFQNSSEENKNIIDTTLEKVNNGEITTNDYYYIIDNYIHGNKPEHTKGENVGNNTQIYSDEEEAEKENQAHIDSFKNQNSTSEEKPITSDVKKNLGPNVNQNQAKTAEQGVSNASKNIKDKTIKDNIIKFWNGAKDWMSKHKFYSVGIFVIFLSITMLAILYATGKQNGPIGSMLKKLLIAAMVGSGITMLVRYVWGLLGMKKEDNNVTQEENTGTWMLDEMVSNSEYILIYNNMI